MDHFQFALLFWSAVFMLFLHPPAKQPAYNWSVRLHHRCWGRKYRVRRSRRFTVGRLRVG